MFRALIAGGSKGIGLSIARALSERKIDLVLVARNSLDLQKAREELEQKYQNRVKILSCDLSLPETPEQILAYCAGEGIDINILCNAAGLGGSVDFPDLSSHETGMMIRTNLESPVNLCLLFKTMLQKNAPSYILNVGSMAGFAPFPVKNLYAATKAALLSFSYATGQQFKDYGIQVSCLCPGPVYTKAAIEQETVRKLKWLAKYLTVDTEKVGQIAVREMFRNKKVIIPGNIAGILSFVLRILPASFSSRMLNRPEKIT